MSTNNPLVEQYELIKEIQFVFDNIEPPIKGKILKVITGPNAKYMWTTNYYCKKADEASVYIPGGPFGNTLEETELKLSQYVKRFEMAVEWRINEYY